MRVVQARLQESLLVIDTLFPELFPSSPPTNPTSHGESGNREFQTRLMEARQVGQQLERLLGQSHALGMACQSLQDLAAATAADASALLTQSHELTEEGWFYGKAATMEAFPLSLVAATAAVDPARCVATLAL